MLVGDDPASASYIKGKRRACDRIGMDSVERDLPGHASQADVVAAVAELNADDDVDGILVQLPLPKGMDAFAVTSAIDPAKDVDGLHPENAGRLLLGEPEVVLHEGRPFEVFARWYRDHHIGGCAALGATGVFAAELVEPAVVLPEDACQEMALSLLPGFLWWLTEVGVRLRWHTVPEALWLASSPLNLAHLYVSLLAIGLAHLATRLADWMRGGGRATAYAVAVRLHHQ